MHAKEVTELYDYVGNSTVGRHGTGSLKQIPGQSKFPVQSVHYKLFFIIFTFIIKSLLPNVLEIPSLHH